MSPSPSHGNPLPSVIADVTQCHPPPREAPSESHRVLLDVGANTYHDADQRSTMEAIPVMNIPQIPKRLSFTMIDAAEDIDRSSQTKSDSEVDVLNVQVDLGGVEMRKQAWTITEEEGAVFEFCQSNSTQDFDPTDTLTDTDAREEQIGDFKRLPGRS